MFMDWKIQYCKNFFQINYRVDTVPVKITAVFLITFDKLIPKFLWRCKGKGTGKLQEEKEGGGQQEQEEPEEGKTEDSDYQVSRLAVKL